MWDTKDLANFESEVADNLEYKDEAGTGFAENFNASVDNEIASGLTISKMIMSAPEREQNLMLRKKFRNDPDYAKFKTLTRDADGNAVGGWDYDAAADYAIASGDEGFTSYADLREARKLAVQQADKHNKEVYANSSNMGTAGNFTGSMATQIIEPVNYVAVIPGVGMAASLGTKVVAGIATNSLASLAALPIVQEWKHENDIEYTDQQMYTDVALSAVFGGAFSALGHGVQKAGHSIGMMIDAMKTRRADINNGGSTSTPPKPKPNDAPPDADFDDAPKPDMGEPQPMHSPEETDWETWREPVTGKAKDEVEALDSAILLLEQQKNEIDAVEGTGNKTTQENVRAIDDAATAQVELTPHMEAAEPTSNAPTDVTYEQSKSVIDEDTAVVMEDNISKLEEQISNINTKLDDDLELSESQTSRLHDQLAKKESDLEEAKLIRDSHGEQTMKQPLNEWEEQAAKISEEVDIEIARMQKTIDCMMGGGT